ncbi:MAG: hypothetical protein ACQESH_04855 [Campylobacterota bacterium]
MVNEVSVYIDEDMDKFMDGVLVCGSVIVKDANENESEHIELIGKTEYNSAEELINDVAAKLNVDPDLIEIES